MKTLLDYQIFNMQKYGGVSRYFVEMFKLFPQLDAEFDLPIKFSENSYLKDTDFFDNSLISKIFPNKEIFRCLKKQNRKNTIKALKKGNYDVFHPTYFDPYFLDYLPENKPFVLTIHDMISEIMPEYFQNDIFNTAKNMRLLASKANHIVVVSENTKQDVLRIYPEITEDKITVTPISCSFENIDFDSIEKSVDLPEKYVLFVGNRNNYKNFDGFIDAAVEVLNQDKDLKVICAGSDPFSNEEVQLFKDHNISDQLIHMPITDKLLMQLYKYAQCFIFPTKYEGFGIPTLEAFWCGCPAILSNQSSVPEVAGNAGYMINPYEKYSIQDAIRKVVYDKNQQDILRELGFKRAKEFSWEITTKRTVEAYQKCL